MNFIGAALLSFLNYDLNHAFILFSIIMKDLQMKDIFQPGLKGAKDKFNQLEFLTKKVLPQLSKTFTNDLIQTSTYASGWIFSLFMSEKSLSPRLKSHILHVFFQDGWKGLFQVMLSLLTLLEPKLIDLSRDDVLLTLSYLQKGKLKIEEEKLWNIHSAIKKNIKVDQLFI